MLGALGLYPEVPGTDVLAISSPLFGRATVRLGGGRKLRILASAPRRPYIQSLRLDGHSYERPWTTFCALAHGATLTYRLGAKPNRTWAASSAALPPSFGPRRPMPKSNCTH